MDRAAPYQVIARKYRPQTFSSVVGQESIVTTLKNGLRFNRLAHAYLFCGCRGTGKTTLARVFAKALNCLHPSDDFEPCNACPSCLDITLGKSLDVLEIDGASNRGIDDVRQLNETIGYTPAVGKYKIYIIDEVHMLTKEAFNALLKTLEEPPPHVKFLFATTEPHKILPTILSRCQRFDLNRIPFETLKGKLLWITQDLKISCDEEVLSLIATISEGSLRDAESLLDQIICYADHPITLTQVSSILGMMPRSVFFALDRAFDEQNLSYAFELASEIFLSGKDLSYFLDHLIEHYRSFLRLKLDASFSFPTPKLKQHYVNSLGLYTNEQCIYILDFLIQSQQQINKTPFKRVHLEMLLLHVIRSKNRITLPALVKRLQELEKQFDKSHLKNQEFIKEPSEERGMTQDQSEKKITPIPSDSSIVQQPQEEIILEKPLQAPLKEELPTAIQQETEHSLDELLITKIQKKLDSLPESQEIPKPSPLLLSKTDWETKAIQKEPSETAIIEEIPIQKIETKAPEPSKEPSPQGCHYDTLIRFAAVELEGIINTSTK